MVLYLASFWGFPLATGISQEYYSLRLTGGGKDPTQWLERNLE